MASTGIDQNDIDHLLEDAAYLQDEADALTYVIEEVPYDELTPDGESIRGYLYQIALSEKEYYRPVIEQTYRDKRVVKLSEFSQIGDSYQLSEEEQKNEIIKVIRKMGKQRASLITLLQKFTHYDWNTILFDEKGRDLSLFSFTRGMITRERALLKKIADLVLIYQNEKGQQREIERKSKSRKRWVE